MGDVPRVPERVCSCFVAYVFASMDFVDWKSFIPCNYGSVLNQTSVMWSLAWGLVMLRVVNSQKIRKDAVKIILVILICLISFPSDWSCVAAGGCFLNSDYYDV